MDISELHKVFLRCGAVTTDTRTLRGGELFFALKGENFDGNRFVPQALEKGAAYAVADRTSEAAASGDPRIIAVDDTLETLQALARYHRRAARVQGKPLTVIGLTGTNGKTTTKELIRSVLAVKYRVTATEGNLNNDIGVPLTLLRITAATELALVEMGANHPDDIQRLVSVCEPDFGLITNVGRAHLLGFGSFEGVKRAKGQLYDWLSAHGGCAFLNTDDSELLSMASGRSGMRTLPYGVLFERVEILPVDAAHPFLRMKIRNHVLETRLVGAYNAANVMAALAVGRQFDVPFVDALDAIAAYEPANSRSQLVRTERNILIVDAYNANPTSMAAALDNFARMEAPHKAVLLGQMGELGAESEAEHVRLLQRIAALAPERVCLVGEQYRAALGEVPALSGACWYPDSASLAAALADAPLEGYTVLVKGSRSTQMEKVIPVL